MSNNNGRINGSKKNFAQVSNHALQDPSLSLKAKGLYAMIESYINIPNFILYKNTLIKSTKDGNKGFQNAWNELKEKGYLIQRKLRDTKNNRFYYEYDLLEHPDITASEPHTPFGGGGKGRCAKGGIYSNTYLKYTDFNNTEKTFTSSLQDDDIINAYLEEYYKHFGHQHRRITQPIEIRDATEDEVRDAALLFFEEYGTGSEKENKAKCSIDNFVHHFERYRREV